MDYAIGLAFILAVLADIFDVIYTEKGLHAGVAVEANTWLVGPKPSAVRLYARDLGLTIAPIFVVGEIFWENPLSAFALAWLAVAVIKHVKGGLAWRRLLNGGTVDMRPQSAWQKFWGD